MSFTIRIDRGMPDIDRMDTGELVRYIFRSLGYLGDGRVRTDAGTDLLCTCFLSDQKRPWTIDEMCNRTQLTRPTMYKYLNRLLDMELVEQVSLENGPE